MAKAAVVGLFMFGVAATACGSDDPAQGTVTTANAALVVSQLGGISASMSAMNGPQAFTSFRELMYAGQSFVVPRDGSPPSRGFFATTVPIMADGAAVCTVASCAFTGYGSFTLAIFTTERLDGTITRSGDTTTFDLTYSLASKLGNLAWTIGGSVATTATSIDGNLHGHGELGPNGSFSSGALTWDLTVDYNAITLDPQGCPTGGSVHVISRYDDEPTTGSPTHFEVQGTVKFGAACAAAR